MNPPLQDSPEGASSRPTGSDVRKDTGEPPKTKSGKSAKAYRLERDAALAQLEVAGVQGLDAKLVNEQTIKRLQIQAKDEVNRAIFKAVDALAKQNRLVSFELSDKCKLEFKV